MSAVRSRVAACLLPACLMAAGAAQAAVPGVADVQSAYDAARITNADKHVFDLAITDAKCSAMKAGGYACQVDFVRRTAPEQRLYFDVVTVDDRTGQWVLLSGLCVTRSR